MKNIVFFLLNLTNIWLLMNCDLCSDLSIESAVRISAKNFMLVFKGQEFWVLNTERSTLTKSKPISKYFGNYGDIKTMIGSWIDTGFDDQNPNKGSIYLLKSKTIYKYNTVFFNENNFSATFEKSYAFGQFWSGYEAFPQIEAMTDLNTIRDKEDYKEVTSRDLLAINSDRFVVLWPEPGIPTYVTSKFLCARSEQNELSVFDVDKRNAEYWGHNNTQDCFKWKGVKMSSIIDPKAFVYFPSGAELYVFGQQEYCKIRIRFSDKNLMCNKQSLKKLFGCNNVKTTTTPESKMIGSQGEVEDDSTDHPVSETQPPNNKQTDTSSPGDAGSNEPSGSNRLWIFIVVAIIIFLLFMIMVVILFFTIQKKKKGHIKVEKYAPVVVQPIDPRYGQLDPHMNLTMRIASPSYQALDTRMENQPAEEAEQAEQAQQAKKNEQKDDKTERSDSDTPSTGHSKGRKKKTKKLHSPRSPIN